MQRAIKINPTPSGSIQITSRGSQISITRKLIPQLINELIRAFLIMDIDDSEWHTNSGDMLFVVGYLTGVITKRSDNKTQLRVMYKGEDVNIIIYDDRASAIADIKIQMAEAAINVLWSTIDP